METGKRLMGWQKGLSEKRNVLNKIGIAQRLAKLMKKKTEVDEEYENSHGSHGDRK